MSLSGIDDGLSTSNMVKNILHIIILCVGLALASHTLAYSEAAYRNTTELDNLFTGKFIEAFAGLNRDANEYLKAAQQSAPPHEQTYKLQAIARAIALHDYHFASRLINQIQNDPLSDEQHLWLQLLSAKLLILKVQPDRAIQYLQDIPAHVSPQIDFLQAYLTAIAHEFAGNALASIRARINLSDEMPSDLKTVNQLKIWQLANHLPSNNLHAAIDSTHSSIEKGWYELALVTQRHEVDSPELQSALIHWQSRNKRHEAKHALKKISMLMRRAQVKKQQAQAHTVQPSAPTVVKPRKKLFKVALLLPLHGKMSAAAKHIQQGFFSAYYQHKTQMGNAIKIRVYDTTLNAARAYNMALRAEPNVIVGPFHKGHLAQVYNKYRRAFPVTTIALNYLAQRNEGTLNFMQFGLSPRDEARQVAERAAFDNHKRAMIITNAQPWGIDVADTFESYWTHHGGEIVHRLELRNTEDLTQTIKNALSVYNELGNDDKQDDQNLAEEDDETPHFEHRKDIDFIFLNTMPKQVRQIIPILKFNYSGDIPIYTTSVAVNDNYQNIRDLDGAMLLDMPCLIHQDHKAKRIRKRIAAYEKKSIGQAGRLYAFGIDAFDVALLYASQHQLPESGFQGLTGHLFLSKDHRIFRQLPWARVNNNRLIPVD